MEVVRQGDNACCKTTTSSKYHINPCRPHHHQLLREYHVRWLCQAERLCYPRGGQREEQQNTRIVPRYFLPPFSTAHNHVNVRLDRSGHQSVVGGESHRPVSVDTQRMRRRGKLPSTERWHAFGDRYIVLSQPSAVFPYHDPEFIFAARRSSLGPHPKRREQRAWGYGGHANKAASGGTRH